MNTNEIIDSLINSVPINTLPTSVNNNNNRKRYHSDMANMSEQPNRTTPTRQLSSSINLPITSAAHLSNQIMSKAPTHTLSTQSLASQAIQTTDDGTLLTMERRMDNKLEISSPQEYFSSMLKSRGYPGTTFCSLKCGYHNSPTVSWWMVLFAHELLLCPWFIAIAILDKSQCPNTLSPLTFYSNSKLKVMAFH